MVPLVVKSQVVGSAYGLWTSVQNIGLALGPLMVGALTFSEGKDKKDYTWVNVSLGSCCVLGIFWSIGLLFADKLQYNGLLQKPSKAAAVDNVDILASPAPQNAPVRNLATQNETLKPYLSNRELRDRVRRSMARSSMAK